MVRGDGHMKRMVLLFALLAVTDVFFQAASCEAAVIKDYYVILDDTFSYQLNEQQYGEIQNARGDTDGGAVLDILRALFGGEQVPGQVSTITFRVYTYSREGNGSADSGTPDETVPRVGTVGKGSPGFDILAGRLMRYCGNEEVVSIPDTVTSISQGAFYGNHKVKKILVPASVTSVQGYAFYDCTNLRYIVFAGTSRSVGANMISRCGRLTNIIAPKSSEEYRYAEKNGIRVFTADRPSFGRTTVRLLVGDSEDIPLYSNIHTVMWSSSNKQVVSVSGKGKIKARKKGTAKITANVEGKTYRLAVRVEEKSEDKRVEQIIKSVVKKGMDTREKVKAVHDWFVRNVRYDYPNYLRGTVPKVSHTAEGALVRGIAVCDGYSRGFQKVMRKLGIPCQLVVGSYEGGGHAWNRVKIGGKWRHVDVTFDDPVINGKNTNKKPYYTYFLKTDKQMKKDHVWR